MGEGLAHVGILPSRLNLSIGNSCWVQCPGCYNLFGQAGPDLARFEASVAAFVACGIRAVTISGGDPLRVPGMLHFLGSLREAGVQSIKLDTVGTGLLHVSDPIDLHALCRAVDILSVPLDGWSEESVAWFRGGRPRLFGETMELLASIDGMRPSSAIYVNTVLHAKNLAGLDRIFGLIHPFRSIRHWNVFQYVSTDQAQDAINERHAVSAEAFSAAAREMAALAARQRTDCEIEFASGRERLGKYFLVNSDGDSWLPDAQGRTVRLGNIFGRERDTLIAWQAAAMRVGANGPDPARAR